MKKILCLTLALLLTCLWACGGEKPPVIQQPTTTAFTGPLEAAVDGRTLTFQPWEGEGLPTSGTYYLAGDAVLTQTVTVEGELNLHLNGHVVTCSTENLLGSLFVVPQGATLTLYDAPLDDGFDLEGLEEAEKIPLGSVRSPKSFNGNPVITSVITVEGTLNVAGGHVDASAISLENKTNGLGLLVADGGVVNMTGGVLSGGINWRSLPQESEEEPADPTQPTEPTEPTVILPPAPEESSLSECGLGGTVYIAPGGTFNLSGGVIRAGEAALGGNVFVARSVEAAGKFTMSGGTVLEGASYSRGGNVYVAGTMEMSGGELTLGESYQHGANLFIEGEFTSTAGNISLGTSDLSRKGYARGGNITVSGDQAKVRMVGLEITDGMSVGAECHGGNLAVFEFGAREFLMEDCTVSGGWGHRGANLYFGHFITEVTPDNIDFVIKNTRVSDGIGTYKGENMCLHSGTANKVIRMTLENCEFSSMEGASRENIALGAGSVDRCYAELVMNGGTLKNGSLGLYGLSQMTLNGVTREACEPGGTGTFVDNP